MADPLAGITGSVNAGLKQTKRQPQFPKGLDQHFGLGPGITGSVNAGLRPPSPKPSFNLGGITGHALAPKATPPSPKFSLGRITGSVNAGMKGPAPLPMASRGPTSSALQRLRVNEAALGKNLAAGQKRVGGVPSIPNAGKALSSKELSKNQLLSLKSAGLGGKNLLAAAGPGLEAMPKKLAAEAVNIPAQVPVAAVKTGIAGVNAIKGHPQELEHMGHEFLNQSAVGQLFQGHFSKAFARAEEHPLATGLEFSGAGSVADRLAGAIKGTKAVDAASVVSREPRPLPETAAPKGGVTEPLKPYDKGMVRRRIEEAHEQQPMTAGQAKAALGRNFDELESSALTSSRSARDKFNREHHNLFNGKLGRGGLGSSAEAVHHFNDGLLSDPSVLGPDGKPLYQDQLARAITRWEREPPNETKLGAEQRTAVLAQLRALQGENPDLTKAYAAAKRIAAEGRAKEPEMVQHHIGTPDTIRIVKLIKPFHTHFEDQNPHVDPSTGIGVSPFRLGGPEGRIIPVDEVAKKLEAKGVHEDQLAFSSTRPFITEGDALRTGRGTAGAKTAGGPLTGYNYIRGHFDSSPEAMTRQLQATTKAINDARFQNEFNRRYPFKAKELAKLIRDRLNLAETEGQMTTLRGYADQLEKQATPKIAKSGRVLKRGQHYFNTLGEARAAQEHLDGVGVHLEPVRIAHPYATEAFRRGMAEKFTDHEDMQDRLEPLNAGDEPVRSRLPHEGMPAETAGPWALVHPTIASKMREYERNLGTAHILQMPSSAWRRMNVAFSVRHIMPGGVPQEMGIRMAANNIGAISALRGTRFWHFLDDYATHSPDPEVKTQWERLKSHTGGTTAAFTRGQGKHIPLRQLADTKLEKPMMWWLKGEKRRIVGPALRGMRMAIGGMNKTTNAILATEQKIVEHPPQVAGLGRHAADEFKRIHGRAMKVAGTMDDLEKQFLRGLLDPKAVDHAANVFTNFWGDWTNSSPKFRNAQAFIPFLRWFVNSARFVYQVMPRDHPVQTSLLVALEQATAEERRLEGQGYKPGTLGIPTLERGQLPEYQQGSIPIGNKERYGAEYYAPSGLTSGGLEGLLGALVPYATSVVSTMKGIDPVTNQPIEEEDPETGRKVPITDQSKLFVKGILAALESMVPPYRYASQLKEKSVGHTFRPFRTEKEHTLGGKEFEGVLKEEAEAAKKGGGKAKKGIPLPKTAMPKTALPKTTLPKVTLP